MLHSVLESFFKEVRRYTHTHTIFSNLLKMDLASVLNLEVAGYGEGLQRSRQGKCEKNGLVKLNASRIQSKM